MFKKLIGILAIVVIALMSIGIFASCSKKEEEAPKETEPPVEADEGFVDF